MRVISILLALLLTLFTISSNVIAAPTDVLCAEDSDSGSGDAKPKPDTKPTPEGDEEEEPDCD